MNRTILVFGTLAGAIISVLMFASMSFFMSGGKPDFDLGAWIGYGSMIVALSMVFVGIRSYRDQHLGGRIRFGEAFKIGLLITLVASAIYVINWMIYYSLGPGQDIMDEYYHYTVEQLQQSGKAAEEVKAEITRMETFNEQYRNPLVRIGMTFLEIFPVGLIVTLVSAGLLRK